MNHRRWLTADGASGAVGFSHIFGKTLEGTLSWVEQCGPPQLHVLTSISESILELSWKKGFPLTDSIYLLDT